MKANKHLYDHIVYDSTNEKNFASELDINSDVAVYVKLPDGYIYNTSLVDITPDWGNSFL